MVALTCQSSSKHDVFTKKKCFPQQSLDSEGMNLPYTELDNWSIKACFVHVTSSGSLGSQVEVQYITSPFNWTCWALNPGSFACRADVWTTILPCLDCEYTRASEEDVH